MVNKLSNRQCLAYSAPVITTACLMTPIGVLQGIYAKYFGLSLTAIAIVLLFSRIFDAITDPLLAYYADRYHQRKGTYKPFIVSGGLLFILSSYFLYTPPDQVSIAYFTCWFFAFYFSWTLFEIPHLALGSGLADHSDAKAQIFSYRSVASYSGWILFYSIPLLPIFESRAITPDVLRITVIVSAGLMLPILWFFARSKLDKNAEVKNSLGNETAASARISRGVSLKNRKQFYRVLTALLKNKPLLIYISAFCLITFSSGMWYSLIFLYVDTYLNLGDQYAQMFLMAFIIGIVGTPVWFRLAIRFGKKRIWMSATLMLMVTYIWTGFLSPGSTGFSELLLLKSVQTLSFACTAMASPAILSEIVDYSRWKYGADNSATYFAIQAFLTKITLALSTALALGISARFGFDASLSIHSVESIFGITLAIAWIPPIFAGLAIILIILIPITERQHHIIHRRLNAKKERRV